MKPPRRQLGQRRMMLAHEAARIIVEAGIEDLDLARRKAARRLGISDRVSMPEDAEIESALAERQRLFRGAQQLDALGERRRAALEAMHFFSVFSPRLTGPVLEGSADGHSRVMLHLHGDEPEALDRFLHEHDIPAVIGQRRIRLGDRGWKEAPAYRFIADGIEFELLWLPLECLRQPPLKSDGGPAPQRTDARGLGALLKNTA